MGFWKDWFSFLKHNAKENMKKISIGIGSFLVLLISSIGFGWDIWIICVYAGIIETGSMILMSIFGKNGNGVVPIEPETTETENTPS